MPLPCGRRLSFGPRPLGTAPGRPRRRHDRAGSEELLVSMPAPSQRGGVVLAVAPLGIGSVFDKMAHGAWLSGARGPLQRRSAFGRRECRRRRPEAGRSRRGARTSAALRNAHASSSAERSSSGQPLRSPAPAASASVRGRAPARTSTSATAGLPKYTARARAVAPGAAWPRPYRSAPASASTAATSARS